MYLQLGVVFVTLFQLVITEKCITPNNEEAECVPLSSCEILLDAVFKAEQSDINEFVRKSKCEGGESDRMVCCGSTSRFLTPMINKNADKDKLIPDRRYCGYQHSDDYFRNETDIGINESPWLAGLVYKYGNITRIGCSGSLISNRYVLTAASCLFSIGDYKFAGVRLGEYNITTDEDCTEDSGFYECSTSPENYDIEKIIPYPQYNYSLELSGFHDIGLLRLTKKVEYSDYIRPICLPTAGTMFAKPEDILLIPGWGVFIKQIDGKQTGIKKKISSKLITNAECAAEYNPLGRSIDENHLCTKKFEYDTEFLCKYDNGAPGIFSFRNQWHQEGVLSFGGGCFMGYPEVYTKVVNYLDWIIENIEP